MTMSCPSICLNSWLCINSFHYHPSIILPKNSERWRPTFLGSRVCSVKKKHSAVSVETEHMRSIKDTKKLEKSNNTMGGREEEGKRGRVSKQGSLSYLEWMPIQAC
jgi:hypothetical protein